MIAYPLITDSHCHLDFPDFNEGLDDIVERAAQNGVHRMVTICTRLPEEPKVRAIAERYENVFYAAGTHPMNAAKVPLVTTEELLSLSEHPKFVAIGETGLDYHYTSESADVQKKSLILHIEAAQTSGLPLIIHARAADEDMAEILTSEFANATYSCVMHCFSSGETLAKAAVDLGFYLSMSGIAAFPKNAELRDIFKKAPVDRILLETDSPYLAPPPYRGKRNEPGYTRFTAEIVSKAFDMSYDDFAAQTEKNFERLFSKAADYKGVL
jgi:TatD DNase family protein